MKQRTLNFFLSTSIILCIMITLIGISGASATGKFSGLAVSPTIRILWIGNSMMYQFDLPAKTKSLLNSLGYIVEYGQETPAGNYLTQHAVTGSNARLKIQNGYNGNRWDYVIVNGNTLEPGTDYNGMLAAATTLKADTLTYNPGAKFILHSTNPYTPSTVSSLSSGLYTTTNGMADDVNAKYASMAGSLNVKYTPNTLGMKKLYNDGIKSELEIWLSDGKHHTDFSHYMDACIHAAIISGIDPTYFTENLTFSQADADYAKSVAKSAITSSNQGIVLSAPAATPTATTTGTLPGSWVTVDDNVGTGWNWIGWTYYNDSGAYGTSGHGSATNGNYGEYIFSGSSLEVYAWKGPDGGSLQILIDGVPQNTVSQYNAVDVNQQLLYSATGLSGASHTLRIVGITSGTSQWAMLDYIRYYTGTSVTSTPTSTSTNTPIVGATATRTSTRTATVAATATRTSTPTATAASVTNLVVNPGFESGVLGAWTNWGSFSVANNNAHLGTYSGTVANVTNGSGGVQRVDALAGSTYTLKGWGKISASQWAAIGYSFLDSAGTKIGTDTYLASFGSAYTEKSATFTAPSGTAKISIVIWNSAGGVLYIDDISLIKN